MKRLETLREMAAAIADLSVALTAAQCNLSVVDDKAAAFRWAIMVIEQSRLAVEAVFMDHRYISLLPKTQQAIGDLRKTLEES